MTTTTQKFKLTENDIRSFNEVLTGKKSYYATRLKYIYEIIRGYGSFYKESHQHITLKKGVLNIVRQSHSNSNDLEILNEKVSNIDEIIALVEKSYTM